MAILGEKALIKIHFLDVLATKFREVGGWLMKLSISSIYSSNKIAVMYLQFFMISSLKKHVKIPQFFGILRHF